MQLVPQKGELAESLGISGFTIPTDYEVVRATLETLRLPPFDRAPEFTFKDIWDKYWWEIVIALALVGVIALLTMWLVFLNRQLAESRRRVERTRDRTPGG